MANFFQDARNVSVNHSQFNSVGGHQVNITQITSSADQSVLASLKPVDRLHYCVAPCMQGTREWIIEQIINWLNNFQTSNILWLSGSPGAGKSTIASTLVERLLGMGRFGSSFFFKRDDVTLNDPARFWRTVAFDLARDDTIFAKRLVTNVTEGKVDLTSTNIELHYKYLIADPLMASLRTRMEAQKQMMWDGTCSWMPMRFPVVVIDALDECGGMSSQSDQRRIFMETITKWRSLNPSLKLIITSRDHNITPSFRQVAHRISLNSVESADREEIDMHIFFRDRFAEITSKYPSLQSWPGATIIKELTKRAAGLFIWANTVLRFVEQGLPERQLKLILDGTFYKEGDAIGKLYQQILCLSFDDPGERVSDTFKKVVGAVVVAKTPLHRKDLIHLLREQEDDSSIYESDINFILNNLSTFISTRNSDNRVHINHLSFTEFVATVMTITRHSTYRLRPWNIVASQMDSLFNSRTLPWNTLLTINAHLYPLIRRSITVVYLPI